MKYFLLLMSSFFLVAPITTFASTPTKELRIVDHQVYLFEDGIQSTQLTTRWNATFVDYWEPITWSIHYPKEKCDTSNAAFMRMCDMVSYKIEYQDQEVAYVQKRIDPANSIWNADFFIFSFTKKWGQLVSIVNQLTITHEYYYYFSVKNNGSIIHETTRSINQWAYGGNFTRKERIELLKNWYNRKIFRDKESPDIIYETYQKVFTLEQLKKLIK